MPMKRFTIALAFILSALPVFASSLGTAARTVIPVDVQQIINVDYRQLKSSDTAMAMKAKLRPPNMKQFEDALKGVGVVPERDLEQITLASFQPKKQDLDIIGITQGLFPLKPCNIRPAQPQAQAQ